jgi:hypothetical protein
MLDTIEIRKPGLLGHELDPATPSSKRVGLRDVLGSSDGTARTTFWAPSPSIIVNNRRARVDVGHPEFAVGDTRPHNVGDAVQPLGRQLLGLGRQRCVAPPRPTPPAIERSRRRWSRRV